MDRQQPMFCVHLVIISLLCAGIIHPIEYQEPVYLFAHGILGTRHQADAYSQNNNRNSTQALIAGPLVTFNFPDAYAPLMGIALCKFWQCSFGQENDIATMARAYEFTRKKMPEKDIVLFGLSRGASVIWSFISLYKPERVKALILESPFDRVQSALDGALNHMPYLLDVIPGARTLAAWVLRYLASKYDPGAADPIDLAEGIPADLPILIVCSEKDKLVPAHSSWRLYQKLRAAGYQHVYFLKLPLGKHSLLLQGPDGRTYACVVHAFYKKYGLRHDPFLAECGQALLEQCQPNLFY